MLRNIFMILAFAVAAVWPCAAQHAPGTWHFFPMHGESFTKVVDTPSKVYYLTGGSLYSYDKEANETKYYIPGESVSNYGAGQIYYNPAGKYVAVTYDNSSIDLIYDDGRMVAVPDIANSNLLTTKAIRHIGFGPSRMYVATDFGLVVIDDTDHHVVESGMYDTPIDLVAEVNGTILVKAAKKLYASPRSARHKDFSSFSAVNTTAAEVLGMGSSTTAQFPFYINGRVYKGTYDAATNTLSHGTLADVANMSGIAPAAAGWVIYSPTAMVEITPELTATTVTFPAELKNNVTSAWKGSKAVWAANSDGIGCFDISAATPSVLAERHMPAGALLYNAHYMFPSADGSAVYLTNTSTARGFSGVPANYWPYIANQKYTWATGEFTNVSPKLNGTPQGLGTLSSALHPFDPSIIFTATVGTDNDGITIYRDDEFIGNIKASQTPADHGWIYWLMGLTVDPEGNLWLGDRTNNLRMQYFILPAEKVRNIENNFASITPADWLTAKLPECGGDDFTFRVQFSTRKNKNKALIISDYGALTTYDTKGTLSTADDSAVNPSMLTQDGNSVGFGYLTALTEDLTGNIWMGTSEGIVIFNDVEQFGTANPVQVIRPKVARNDGTVYADYLLSTDIINYIAVDANNRKWVATEESGVFLVSADGTEILENFTKDNSPLVSNTVYAVYCSPEGNDVLLSTPAGMMLYSSTASPAADDYSEVFAYPNPVRPDYEGWITVQGLMNDSLVKIADAQGNVVASGRSEGGMFVWDGCNSAGERVRSGIYLVLASQYDGSSSSGIVTKIVVIN